jgi:predicted  nucleic acid-binding Zn-ribbon protein
MTDHSHEAWEVYGLDSTSRDAREALSVAEDLRQSLDAAEERIRELENRIRELEDRIRELEDKHAS